MKPWVWVLVWGVIGFCFVAPGDLNAGILYAVGILISGLGVVGIYEARKGKVSETAREKARDYISHY